MKTMAKATVTFSLAYILFAASVAAATDVKFTDVPPKHWAKSYIQSAVGVGWIGGYADQSFKPENNITRAEFLKALIGAMKFNVTDEDTSFTDDTGWFRPYIATGLNQGVIVAGAYPNDEFKPNQKITRGEIAEMAVRALGKNDEGQSKGYVAVAKSLGILSGYADGTMGENKNATRAEAVVMISRVLNPESAPKPPVKVTGFPKTTQSIMDMVNAAKNKYGTVAEGFDGAVIVHSGNGESYDDIIFQIIYNSSKKLLRIEMYETGEKELALLKDLLKVYLPSSYEKAYKDSVRVSKTTYTPGNDENRSEAKYDNHKFITYKPNDNVGLSIVIYEE
ncbi:S-layer homology domain-containing protein [Cohnella sp. REN36]|uniref:S-layer homology domain-containing protein n=1 Tax=Cohnella sp. REN36 TaxID=2887347 RepID=UPI001D14FCD2|nr:S-layer homology domain-containing protein [Cohnella sp. REN36]MCC3374754.1 S-layer homology domain-containing protein [Cohnella sp. REN36]